MLDILGQIKEASTVFQGTGHYLILFLVALVFMMLNKNEVQNRNFYLYSLISVLIICIPFTAINIKELGGFEKNYYNVFYILPILVLISYVGTRFLENQKKLPEKILVCVIYAFILLLVGTYDYQSGFLMKLAEHDNRYEETENIKDILSVYENVKVIAPKEVCEQIKEYDSNIKLLYGSDIINNSYSNPKSQEEKELRMIYEDITSTPENIEKIASLAQQYGCNSIILDKEYGDDYMMQIWGFHNAGETEHYLIYMN